MLQEEVANLCDACVVLWGGEGAKHCQLKEVLYSQGMPLGCQDFLDLRLLQHHVL